GVVILNNNIFATGTANNEFALVRLDMAGNLVTGFGNNGRVATDFLASNDTCNAVAIYSSTQLILAGTTVGSTTGQDIALARYNVDAAPSILPLDASFGVGGLVAKDIAGHSNTFGNAVAIQPDGKILVAGGDGNMNVTRFNANGALDTNFGLNGIA